MRRERDVQVCGKRVSTVALILMLGFWLTACNHWRDNYFDDGVDEVTQQDVRIKFGKPHIVKDPFLSEGTTWIYRYGLSESELDPMGVKTLGHSVNVLGESAAAILGKGGEGGPKRERVLCVRYVLTFDDSKVLRDWKREPCQPRKPVNSFGGTS